MPKANVLLAALMLTLAAGAAAQQDKSNAHE